jgi:hypothetical protein
LAFASVSVLAFALTSTLPDFHETEGKTDQGEKTREEQEFASTRFNIKRKQKTTDFAGFSTGTYKKENHCGDETVQRTAGQKTASGRREAKLRHHAVTKWIQIATASGIRQATSHSLAQSDVDTVWLLPRKPLQHSRLAHRHRPHQQYWRQLSVGSFGTLLATQVQFPIHKHVVKFLTIQRKTQSNICRSMTNKMKEIEKYLRFRHPEQFPKHSHTIDDRAFRPQVFQKKYLEKKTWSQNHSSYDTWKSEQ